VDYALAEIARLPGRHLYFLDDHLLGDRRFARALFDGMRGMNRLFQGAATVDSILRDDLIERAADAGLRSLFVGFETLTPATSPAAISGEPAATIRMTKRLHDLGIAISSRLGMDGTMATCSADRRLGVGGSRRRRSTSRRVPHPAYADERRAVS
jgi:hypothetical protein